MPGGRTWAVQLNTIILEIGCGVCGVLGASEVVEKSSPLCLRQMRNRVIGFFKLTLSLPRTKKARLHQSAVSRPLLYF